MRTIHLTVHDVLAVFNRRRRLFFFTVVLVASLCTIGAFLLPRKYESTSTIMVQKDEVLNPLVSFTMAVTMASEDRLRSINEIIFSQKTIQMLIDSLGLAPSTITEEERQRLIKDVQKDIETERRGSDSFRITYDDTDPYRAQRGVLFLANYFIKMELAVENQRNETAVDFFEKKLEELRVKFEANQAQVVATLKERISEMPLESRSIYTNIEDDEKSIGSLNDQIQQYEQGLAALRTFPEAMKQEGSRKALFALLRTNLPYVDELRTLLFRYDDLMQRYTESYPEVQKLTYQILDLIARIRNAVEAEIPKKQNERWQIEQRRAANVESLKQTTVSERVDDDKQSDYEIYRKLYDEMKIKLEQARTARDLGRKGNQQFIIIDPPVVPQEPAKPNRKLIALGGLGLGIVLAIVSIATAEILDLRIRFASDLAGYRKPIIAFLPEGSTRQ